MSTDVDANPDADAEADADADADADVEAVGEDCLADWCADDDWCALTCAVDAIGNKWAPVVVERLLADGPLRFSALGDAVPPVSNKTLSATLDDLEASGVVDREVAAEKPVAVEYSLTERGRELEPVIRSLREWGEATLAEGDDDATTDCSV